MVASARTLADISDERVVPVDYLLALIALFLLMVLDRLCYSLGNCAGKARARPPRARAALPAPSVHVSFTMFDSTGAQAALAVLSTRVLSRHAETAWCRGQGGIG